jgi:hypothetical protein
LNFQITFQNVANTNLSGTASVYIVGNDAAQDFINRTINNANGLLLNADHVSGEGGVTVMTQYQLESWSDFFADGTSKAGTGVPPRPALLQLNGSGDYQLPVKGNLIRLLIVPKTEDRKVTASSQQAAVDQVAGTLSANGGILSATLSGTTGSTTTAGQTSEYTVHVLTGGLVITQQLSLSSTL